MIATSNHPKIEKDCSDTNQRNNMSDKVLEFGDTSTVQEVCDKLHTLSENKTGTTLRLLDLSLTSFTKSDIEVLLKFMHTSNVNVSRMILWIPDEVDFCEELLTDWQYIAPLVFAGGLRIVG